MPEGAPTFRLSINRRDLSAWGYTGSVRRLVLEEHDTLADIVRIEIVNPNEEITNDSLFEEKARLQVEIGWGDHLENFGTFVIEEPRYVFPEGDTPTIVIVGFGEDIRLAASEKRRTFRKMTDSQIAQQIASEYSLRFFDDLGQSTIDNTTEVYDEVVQASESDMVFLQKRAELHGFLVYVEGGSLHFHAMRNEKLQVAMRYGVPKKNPFASPGFRVVEEYDILRSEFKTRTFLKGRKLTETNRDKLQKRGLTWSSNNEPDALTLKQISDPNLRRASDLVSVLGVQPEEFLINRGQNVNFAEIQRLATEGAKARQFIVEGRLMTRGAPRVRAKRVVELKDLAQFSGDCYVKVARHEIEPKRRGFISYFDVRRTTIGRLSPGVAQPRAGLTSSSGTMRPNPALDDTLSSVPVSQQATVVQAQPGSFF